MSIEIAGVDVTREDSTPLFAKGTRITKRNSDATTTTYRYLKYDSQKLKGMPYLIQSNFQLTNLAVNSNAQGHFLAIPQFTTTSAAARAFQYGWFAVAGVFNSTSTLSAINVNAGGRTVTTSTGGVSQSPLSSGGSYIEGLMAISNIDMATTGAQMYSDSDIFCY